jgi:glutamate dehydrogenase (NAD(P)+)
MNHNETGRHVVHYVDPVEGFRGFLAFGGDDYRLAAGGCRVIPGLDEVTITALADAMTLKQRLLGLAVDGAKAGIDYDPRAPGKAEALRRFVRFLRPYLEQRFSMGPDRGTTWNEIEGVAREEGLASVKLAVARAQELDEAEFRCRLAVLDAEVNGVTVGQRRAGHALAHAALAACEAAGVTRRPLLAAVQGFGNLGRGATLSLAEAGVAVTAVADEHGCLSDDDGLDVAALLAAPPGTAFTPEVVPTARFGPRDDVVMMPVDVVVLAACEEAITAEQSRALHARAVVVGANLGLSRLAEEVLHLRDVTVVPDFVGGCGGSASMDALFGPALCPSAGQVLSGTADLMQSLVHEILDLAQSSQLTPREAALSLSGSRPVPPGKPYGQGRCGVRQGGQPWEGAMHERPNRRPASLSCPRPADARR